MRRAIWILLCLLLTASLAGCTGDDGDGTDDGTDGGDGGDDGNTTATPDPVALTVVYEGVYPQTTEYTDSLTVEAGAELTLTFENNDQNVLTTHDWYLEALDEGTELIGAGESTSITFVVDLEPGDYVYYCTVQGHRGNGMEGTLTVTAPSAA